MSSSIPSTTSVFQKLNQQISTPATVSACLQAVSLLSEVERKVLVESPAKYHITPTDKEAFTTAAVRALSSDDLDQELVEAASGASDAVNGILELMVGLIINLAWGDSMNGTHLTEQYEPIMRLYCKTMRDGIPLANTIAQYAEDFDNKVIGLCADSSLTMNERISTIQGYIKDAEGYQTTATEMQSTLESVFEKTIHFINQLGSQSLKSDTKERAKGFPAPRLTKKFPDVPLDVQIPALRVALESPFGPYVMIAGLLGVANPEATIAAYSIAASMTNQEYVPITTVISDLATQGQSGSAEDTNTEYFNEFREHIGVLAGYWGSTLIDAREIESWLKMGASLVDIPTYMEKALNGGVKLYVKVGNYLRLYAEQTSQIPWDHWVNADENS
ncbi:hypothetical protein BDV37DRAFT_244889 [Aspergillus pseudonomiae]|uniref:Uncharacterized protein n=1 Tax=Aspergillus pseudonomiae TaxID=1506151 RepID=A0A5N7DGT2_9EURO|nr:uncharacterized protein BDV37DRAFT_244889 [Aspergillus pseudonomiae]KAE8405620.1 hypothetical protein BDV37DRAFT_244889 [Aspergillus pseudonomiae]